MITTITAYTSLFLSALLAATIIPAQSEALLLALVSTNQYSITLLMISASIGNILGSVINWWLGSKLEQFKHKKWFPFKPNKLEKYQNKYQKYGRWLLLLSWVPIIGDPITVAAGVMKENLRTFITIVSIAKIGRYLFIIASYYALFT